MVHKKRDTLQQKRNKSKKRGSLDKNISIMGIIKKRNGKKRRVITVLTPEMQEKINKKYEENKRKIMLKRYDRQERKIQRKWKREGKDEFSAVEGDSTGKASTEYEEKEESDEEDKPEKNKMINT